MPSPTNAQLGAAIRQARKDRGISIESLAAEAGLDRTTVSNIERGIANPAWSTITSIADELRVDAVDLIRVAVTLPDTSS